MPEGSLHFIDRSAGAERPLGERVSKIMKAKARNTGGVTRALPVNSKPPVRERAGDAFLYPMPEPAMHIRWLC